jgi:hypothetical protein
MIYDPKLHRFLQPDNYVQDPSNTQNYNRYGYVLNNPLKYTDPSGEENNCPTCPDEANNFPDGSGNGLVKSLLNFFENKENAEWVSNNLKSGWGWVDRNASSVGQFIGRNFKSAWNDLFGGHHSSGPAPNMTTNVKMSAYDPGDSNSYSMLSNMWNSPMIRSFAPDRVGFSVSSSITSLFGMSDSIDFNWITIGNDGRFLPYITSTVGGHVGFGTDSLIPTADAFFSPTIGWYNSLDLRQLPKGVTSNGLLGYGTNANVKVADGFAGSVGVSVGYDKELFHSPTWFSLYAGIGLGTPSASVNTGASYTYPWHIFHFKN